MIKAEQFFRHITTYNYGMVSGVPCSFLTPIINYAITEPDFRYISAANEGDAVAIAAGSTLGGHPALAIMQNSGLGNAVNPITSLLHTFRIPILFIITLRGDPELGDEPQHELMGKITGDLLDSLNVNWSYFPEDANEIEPSLACAEQTIRGHHLPYAFVMRKGSVGKEELIEGKEKSLLKKRNDQVLFFSKGGSEKNPSRREALQRIVEITTNSNCVVIATTGYTGRELFALADRPNHLYMVGSMGCASSLALGLALARPDIHVIVIDGDGAALMRLGNFTTIGSYAPQNLTHILLDNGVHDSTGGQATTSPGLSFAHIASECGYRCCLKGDCLSLIDHLLKEERKAGPNFGHLTIRRGTSQQLPRPTMKPHQVRERFMKNIEIDCKQSFSRHSSTS